MKFVELDLRAYGPFTNTKISFEKEAAQSGLHLILGPNEAGKSTALRALRAVLFGMEEKRDAHLHPWDMLRVGLKLRTADGQVLDVERRKGKGSKSLLFMDSGKPASLNGILPVDDADQFETMFGIDYERLLKGGRELARFEGDVGRTMLAAAGDLGGIVSRMQELQAAAEEIYAPQASKPKLNKALKQYKDAEAVIRQERFSSAKYKEAVRRRNDLDEELNQIASELARYAEEQNRLTRIQTAAPHVQRWQRDAEELETVSDAVVLLNDFEQRFQAATNDHHLAGTQRDDALAELKRLERELEGVSRDSVLAALVGEIDALHGQTGQIAGARKDLPKREARLQQLAARQEELCTELGIQSQAVPRLTAEQRKRIESLSTSYFGLKASREQLPGRVASLELRLHGANSELFAVPVDVDPTELKQRLGQIPAKKRSGAETRRLNRERDSLQARLEKDLQAFPFWNGTAEKLETTRVPLAASVAEMSERFTRQGSREQDLSQRRDELLAEAKRRAQELELLDQQGSIPTEKELAEARDRRNLGWRAVKDRWLAGIEESAAEKAFLSECEKSLPDAYESAVEAADSVADRLRREAERVEKKRSALREREHVRRQLADQETSIEAARRARLELEREWIALWAESGMQPRTPREMSAWLHERGKLIGQLRDLGRVAGEAAEAEKEERQWCELLASALGTSPQLPLSELAAKAETVVADAEENRRKRADLAVTIRNTESDLRAEIENQQQNESALAQWSTNWKAAIQVLPVSETADPEIIKKIIRLVEDFWKTAGEIQELQHRVDAMRQDEDGYTRAVRELAVRAGHQEWATDDPLFAIGAMQGAARAASEAESASERIAKDELHRKQELARAVDDIERYTAVLEDLRKETNAADLNRVQDAIERSKRKSALTGQIRGHLEALAESSGGAPLEQFIAEVQATNTDQLVVQIDQLREKTISLERQKTETTRQRDEIDREFRLHEDVGEVHKAAVEKCSAAARIDELAMEYLERQIGAKLLARAVDLYRTKHQDPLLKRAGEYFFELTCGSFSGLAINFENNVRVLNCMRPSGVALAVEDMSDGARDQLFLALRLAYIENYCCTVAACPVILDDVLMAFDNERAGAALKALRSLSRQTQVLVFTHHAHHLQLAEEVLGSNGFQLHRLGAPVTAAA